MIFLPCATSLVSYSMIFKSLFANDGLVNRVLSTVGIPTVDWFQNAWAARWVIVIALIWRWTGYNMVFYLAGLQNIDYSIYEAARIDGASPIQQFIHLTIPLLKPTILLTAIMSTSGTLQLFDESVNLTAGGPGKATMTLTHYISPKQTPPALLLYKAGGVCSPHQPAVVGCEPFFIFVPHWNDQDANKPTYI